MNAAEATSGVPQRTWVGSRDERRAGLGHDFLAAVDEAVARLKEGARGGRLRVLAIAHDRRRPGYWRKRL